MTKLKPIVKGIISYLPIIKNILKKKGTGGSSSALYCYSVWMRHLIVLNKIGLNSVPQMVGELGPGDSLGVGLAAMLSGAKKYFALDSIKHADISTNMAILDDLVKIYKRKETIPNTDEFLQILPYIDNYDFPQFLNPEIISSLLEDEVIQQLKRDITNVSSESSIQYTAPWYETDVLRKNCLDLLISQAVMEHVLSVETTYKTIFMWLKPGGYMSHIIDYGAHETENKWYGHLLYNDFVWKIIMHGRKYPINRLLHSAHINMIKQSGFEIILDNPYYSDDVAPSLLLRNESNLFTNNDLKITSAHIIARKK